MDALEYFGKREEEQLKDGIHPLSLQRCGQPWNRYLNMGIRRRWVGRGREFTAYIPRESVVRRARFVSDLTRTRLKE